MKLRTKFQDEDFELGGIVDADVATMPDGRIKLQAVAKAGGLHTIFYDKLSKLYVDWEDASEEPKEYWHIFGTNITHTREGDDELYDKKNKEIGNYFETKEEAEKTVEKLKAWERLKEKGFRFRWIDMQTGQIKYSFFLKEGQKVTSGGEDDLLALFRGEE